MEKLGENFYKVEVPLPGNPLRAVNSYVIKGPERNLIIDTGMNRKECLEALQTALAELNIDLAVTDFFITHLHADHLGLVGTLKQDGAAVYFNAPDAEFRGDKDRWDKMISFARLNGFPEHEVAALMAAHPGLKYRSNEDIDFTILEHGDRIACGEYDFTCVHTPGHTGGHLCLYEASRKWLLAGDMILGDITPNIQQWNSTGRRLERYLQSLDKLDGMDVDLVLPGHRRLIKDHRGRIAELKEHHRVRLEEVLTILAHGPADAYTVATRMSWDIHPKWESFPVTQKWFATGEALAHVIYLYDQRKIKQEEAPGRMWYSLP